MPPNTPPFFSETLNYWYIYGLSKKQLRVWDQRGVYRLKTTKTSKQCLLCLFICHTCQISKWTGGAGWAGSGDTSVLVEAITFECQKIILAVIFSNIRATAKAMNGHGGKGNDLLLLPMTVHNSIFNIFSFKSLRSLLMYLAYLIYVFLKPTTRFFFYFFLMFSFVIRQHAMWQLKWNLLYYFPAIRWPCIIALNAL